jgi:molybdate/tungstate transport system substrate-binding protein
MKHIIAIPIFLLCIFAGCVNSTTSKKKHIIVFHAGSLSVPFKQLKSAYEKMNPDIEILLEAAGSLVCARKVTELRKPCDIVASADYYVISELLIPEYSLWSIRFATNEIVVAYHKKSKYSSEIGSDNWIDILLRDDVIYGRSDPDSDPCGYRTVFTMMLAEKYYKREGLKGELSTKNKEYIRPKEVDLIALIESDAIDYMFQYKSVAIQHGLDYIELPDEINLSDPSKEALYNSVSLNVTGSKPDENLEMKGGYINYSITVLDKAPEKEEAVDFLSFILSDAGLEIIRQNGQNPIIPFLSEQSEEVPLKLLRYLPDQKNN